MRMWPPLGLGLVGFILILACPVYGGDPKQPLGERFWDSLYNHLNSWNPEKKEGVKLPDCPAINAADLIKFSESNDCGCGYKPSAQSTREQVEAAVSSQVFDMSYKVKFKKTQCQVETLDSFDTHQPVGFSSYGGLTRLPLQTAALALAPYANVPSALVKDSNQNASGGNFGTLNSRVSGSSLNPWGNGAPVRPFHEADANRETEVFARQKAAVENLFQAIQAISKIGKKRNDDIDNEIYWKQDPGSFNACMANAYKERVDRRVQRINNIFNSAWGSETPEVKMFISKYAYLILNPNDQAAKERFEYQMINKKGFQGLVQDIGNRLQDDDLHSLRKELASREKDGRFSRGFRESLVREGYFNLGFDLVAPQTSNMDYYDAAMAGENLRCTITKMYKRGPEILEKDTEAFWLAVDAISIALATPNFKAEAVEDGLARLYGRAVARRLLVAATDASRTRKLFATVATTAVRVNKTAKVSTVISTQFAIYSGLTEKNAGELADKKFAPDFTQLCFRPAYTSPTKIDAPPYDDVQKIMDAKNTTIHQLLTEDETDKADPAPTCKSTH